MKDYTDITVLLDRSGSMQTIKTSMESGFDEFVKGHIENPSTRLTLIQFDGQNDQEVVYTDRPIAEVPRLTIVPRDWTPLLDAMCKAIDATGRRLSAMPESERPSRVLFITITDGEENASRLYRRADVRGRVRTQENIYNWRFLYLGANQDAIAEAETFGIPRARAMTYTASLGATSNAWRGVTANTLNYAHTGSEAALDWSDQQRKEAEDGSPNNSNS